MDLQTTIYIIVGLSFALYIGIAIWARAGSTSEFRAAGGSVHLNKQRCMATAADWMSAASFISVAGLIANMGCCARCSSRAGRARLRAAGHAARAVSAQVRVFTVPQFIGDRFTPRAPVSWP